MEVHLLLGGQARHRSFLDRAGDEAFGRVNEGRGRVQGRLRGVAVVVEHQRMKIDLTLIGIGDDEPNRTPIERFGETEFGQGGEDGRLLVLPVHESKSRWGRVCRPISASMPQPPPIQTSRGRSRARIFRTSSPVTFYSIRVSTMPVAGDGVGRGQVVFGI